ncbi:hypothetical protein QF017_006437, partial [Pseudomonas laurylsulfatiphila]
CKACGPHRRQAGSYGECVDTGGPEIDGYCMDIGVLL